MKDISISKKPDAYPLTYGQAADAAVAGATVESSYKWRYTYSSVYACLICIHNVRPTHDEIISGWRIVS